MDHPIFTHERCICSPHVLGLTPGAMERIYRSMATDLAAVLAGKRPRFKGRTIGIIGFGVIGR